MEIIETEEQKEKKIEENWAEPEVSGDTIKWTSIYIVGVPEEEEWERKRAERIFVELMVENVPNLMKNMNINIQEVQWTLRRWTQRDLHQDIS